MSKVPQDFVRPLFFKGAHNCSPQQGHAAQMPSLFQGIFPLFEHEQACSTYTPKASDHQQICELLCVPKVRPSYEPEKTHESHSREGKRTRLQLL